MNKLLKYTTLTLLFILLSPLYGKETINVSNNSIKIKISIDNSTDLSALRLDSNGYYLSYNFISNKLHKFKVLSSHKLSKKAIPTLANKAKFIEKDDVNYTINSVGTYKGINTYNIRVYPAFISKNKPTQINQQLIEIQFDKPMRSEYPIPGEQYSFFVDAINLDHLAYLSRQPKHSYKDENALQGGEYFYNPAINFIEVNTHSDGIGYIEVSDMLAINPDLNNRNYEFIHLIKDGKEVPYFVKSNRDILDARDTLYFISSRNAGDTTYFDHYNTSAKYYIYYDVSKSRKQLIRQEYANIINTLPAVNMTHHFEKDSIYSEGQSGDVEQNYLDPRPVSGEGWYEANLRPNLRNTYEYQRDTIRSLTPLLFPAEGGTAEINFAFVSTTVNDKIQYNHRVKSVINNAISKTEDYPFIRNSYKKYFKQSISNDSLFLGTNHFDFHAIPLQSSYTQSTFFDDGMMGYDYFEVSGRFLPIVLDDKISFNIDKVQEKANIELYPFSNDEIIAIDSSKNYIFDYFSERGDAIAVNTAISFAIKPITTFYFNNLQTYISEKMGYHLAYSNYGSFAGETFDNIDALINKINGLSHIGEFLIAINKELSSDELIKLKGIHLHINNYDKTKSIAAHINLNDKTAKFFTSKNITKLSKFIKSDNGNRFRVNITLPAGEDYNLVVSAKKAFNRAEMVRTYSSDLRNEKDECNYLIITSREFEDQAKTYTNYRTTTHFTLKTKIVFVEDIFKEYSYGRKNPSAIKDYIKQVYYKQSKEKLQAILLLGDASIDPRRLDKRSIMRDIVPTFGYPVSDNWYVQMEDRDDYIADVLISRLPIQTPSDFDNYLEKLKVFENSSSAPWKQSALFMVGGGSPMEQSQFKYFFSDPIINLMKSSKICFDYEEIYKNQDNKVSESDGPRIINALNKGKILTYFVGHGSAEVIEMEGWMPENLSNNGKTGFFLSSSCSMGAFGVHTSVSRLEQLLFVKDKGFIATAANSTTDYPTNSTIVSRGMLNAIMNDGVRNYVQAYNIGKAYSLKNYPDANHLRNLKRFALTGTVIGDPLLNLPMDTLADLYILPNEFRLYSNKGTNVITENDEYLKIDLTIRNSGIKNFDSVVVQIDDEYQGKKDSVRITLKNVCPSEKIMEYKLPIAGKYGLHNLIVTIDPDSTIAELKRYNNKLLRQFEVVKNAILPIEPMPNWNVSVNAPLFRFINPAYNADSVKYSLQLVEKASGKAITGTTTSELNIQNKVIDWQTNIELKPNHDYLIQGSYWDNATGNSSQINIPFHTYSQPSLQRVNHKINLSSLNDMKLENMEYELNKKLLLTKVDSTDFNFISMSGTTTLYEHPVYKGIYLRIGDKFHISEPIKTGMYIAKLSSELSKEQITFYDTWGNYGDEDAIKDSTPIKIVRYLQDSIKQGDKIFIGTIGPAWRVFSLHKKLGTAGSWDTLRTTLKSFGAKEIDIIDTCTINRWENSWGYSYVFYTHARTDHFDTYDKVNIYGDTAKLSMRIPINYTRTSFAFELKNIDILHSLKINASENMQKNNILHKLYGYKKDKDTLELLAEYNNFIEYDYADKSKYDSYKFEFTFTPKTGEIIDFDVSSIDLEYTPTAEADIYQTRKLSNELLKADEDTLSLHIRNLSTRRMIDSLALAISVSDGFTQIDKIDTTFTNIKANEVIEYNKALETDNYSDKIQVESSISNLNNNDIYYFNNSIVHSQSFATDTVKPEVLLEVDGHIVRDGEFVPRSPEMKVILLDNSRRKINTDKSIKVTINLRAVTSERYPSYEFTAFGKDTNIRATLTFKPDSLDYDENVIRIIAEDANSNKDTVRYRLFVSRRGEIKHISMNPNPAINNSKLVFNYAAPSAAGYALFEIYDAVGRLYSSQKTKLNIGFNEIPIKLRDSSGARLPIGLYYYRVSIVDTEIQAEPMTEKLIILE